MNKLNEETYVEVFFNHQIEDEQVQKLAELITGTLKSACDASMPRKRVASRRRENCRWNDKIVLLRKEC